MYKMLIKQALAAMGMHDPAVLKMADELLEGGFENPRLEAFAGDSYHIPAGSDVMLVSAGKLDSTYSVLLVRQKKS